MGLWRIVLAAATAAAFAGGAQAARQDAIDACIDGVRAEVGGGGGEVLGADRMGESWYVHLSDASGGEWDCYASDAGRMEQLTAVQPAANNGGPEAKAARQACRQALRREAGRGGISVQSVETSEANTLVMMTKEGEGAWRCLSSSAGEVAELTRAD